MGILFPARIFPLHLTPIERFLLDDDRPSHPMSFVIEMDFDGAVDTAIFQRAMEAALYRHPLLISKIGPAKNQSECWLKPDGTLPRVDIGAYDQPLNMSSGDGMGAEWLDLKKEVGLRVWIRVGEDKSRITFQFHHVCCDGIGSYRFLGDLLAFYAAGISGDEAPEIPLIDAKRLRGRADRCRFLSRGASASELIKSSLQDCYRILGRGCDSLAVNKASKGEPQNPFPRLSSYTFSAAEFSQLRDASKELGLMLNDLLVMELFQTMHFWNAEVKGRERDGRYRIMMPVDLRSTEDFETPATNVIGYTFLSRRGSDLKDRQKLASSIREETAGIKHHRLGERFNDMVAVGDYVRFFKKLAMRLPRPLCTAVLSNVGDPSRRFLAKFERKGGCVVAGNLTLTRITGSPPVRKRSRASISIVTYRRELTISLRCDPLEFSKTDSERLLTLYVASLRKHITASTSATPETAPQLLAAV